MEIDISCTVSSRLGAPTNTGEFEGGISVCKHRKISENGFSNFDEVGDDEISSSKQIKK